MATATFKFNAAGVVPGGDDIAQGIVRYFGTITFSAAADTYASNGLSPAAGFDLKSLGPYADRAPIVCYIESAKGQALTYLYNASTGKLQIYGGGGSGTAGLTEITNGTALNGTSPTISGDDVRFEVVFPRR